MALVITSKARSRRDASVHACATHAAVHRISSAPRGEVCTAWAVAVHCVCVALGHAPR